MRVWARAVWLLFLVAPALAAAAPLLDRSGVCPGVVTLDVAGLTPLGSYAILSAQGPGAAPVPAGPCAGTALGIGPAGLTLRAIRSADGSGADSLSPALPAAVCSSWVQVLDLTTCEVSNPLGLTAGRPFCGNGVLEAGEACDDGNRIVGDGCSAVCLSETDVCLPSWQAGMGGQYFDAHVDGDMVTFAMGLMGVEIWDASDPVNPVALGRYPSGNHTNAVYRTGSLLLVADGRAGLQVLDVSDPTAPVLTGSFPVGAAGGGAYHVEAIGSHALLVDVTDAALKVIDLTDPANPALAAELPLPGIDYLSTVEVVGDLALVSAPYTSTYLVDVSDPTTPVVLSTLVGEADFDAAVAGDTLYVANDWLGVDVVDISDPSVPVVVGTVGGGCEWGVETDGDRLLVLDYCSGAFLYDLSVDPQAPVLIGSWAGADENVNVTSGLNGDRAWLTKGRVLEVVDFGAVPTLVAEHPSMTFNRGLWVENDVLYATSWDVAVHAIDVTDPTSPQRISSWDAGNGIFQAWDLEVAGGLAYVAGSNNESFVVDVSDPTAMSPVATIGPLVGNFTTGIDLVGTQLFLANHVGGVVVADVTVPSAPVIVDDFKPVGDSVAVAGDALFAYVGQSGGSLAIVDVSAPPFALVSATPITGTVVGVDIDGDQLVLVSMAGGMSVWDVTDRSAPAELGAVLPGDVGGTSFDGLTVRNGIAYVTDAAAGLFVFDLSDPTAPVLIQTAPAGFGEGIFLWEEATFTTGYYGMRTVGGVAGVCLAQCGNAVVEYPEVCDDGNLVDGDGCSAACQM